MSTFARGCFTLYWWFLSAMYAFGALSLNDPQQIWMLKVSECHQPRARQAMHKNKIKYREISVSITEQFVAKPISGRGQSWAINMSTAYLLILPIKIYAIIYNWWLTRHWPRIFKPDSTPNNRTRGRLFKGISAKLAVYNCSRLHRYCGIWLILFDHDICERSNQVDYIKSTLNITIF